MLDRLDVEAASGENYRVMDRKALATAVSLLQARADEFGRGRWSGPGRAALEKAILSCDPVLSQATGLDDDGAQGLRREIQSRCHELLAKMKTTRLEVAHFDTETQSLSDACRRLLVKLGG